jgi:hypothetical protein
MFSYAIDQAGKLLVIDEYQAVPLYQLPRSADGDEAKAVAVALTELSVCLVRSLGTFHRAPSKARMDERWAERRRESLGIIETAIHEQPHLGLKPSDPRYRGMREAAQSVRSAMHAIGDPKLMEAVTAVISAEIEGIESQEDAGVFGGSTSAVVAQRIG